MSTPFLFGGGSGNETTYTQELFDTRIVYLLQLYVGDNNPDSDEMQYLFALECLDVAYPVGGNWISLYDM